MTSDSEVKTSLLGVSMTERSRFPASFAVSSGQTGRRVRVASQGRPHRKLVRSFQSEFNCRALCSALRFSRFGHSDSDEILLPSRAATLELMTNGMTSSLLLDRLSLPLSSRSACFSCETRRLRAREYFHRLPDPMEIRFFAPQAPVYGWKRRVGPCLDKGQGPVIRWRDDFLIIAPSCGAPSGLVGRPSRVCVYHVNP